MPEIIFSGPEGRIEGRYIQFSANPNAPTALFLHPHPQHGGTMNNKVVYTLYQAFARRGFSVLRFNFRGVGRSQGTFDNGLGELSDAAAALDWMQSLTPDSTGCWVGGYSFGAWIGMQLLMRRPEIDGFISIAPPANLSDFSFLAPCPASGLIVHGAKDTIVPEPEAAKLVQKLSLQRRISIDYQVVPGADHFFEGKFDALSKIIETYLDKALAPRVEAAAS